MRRPTLLFALLALIASACGGGEGTADPTTTTTSAATTTSTAPATTTTTEAATGFVAMSDDGRVWIEVTPGALGEDPGVTIARVAPEDHPEEFAGLDVPPVVYTLEPDGLEFAEPVRVSMRVGVEDLLPAGFEGTLPLATLITTEEDGWGIVDDIRISRDETDVTISGLIDHFSGLALVHEQIFVRTRFVEISQDRTQTFGFDFVWSNGVPLAPPTLTSSGFVPTEDPTAGAAITGALADGLVTVACPPSVTTLPGDLEITTILDAVLDSSGQTGIVATPRIPTLQDQQATVTVVSPTTLLCRPTITNDGSMTIDLQVDHPGGAEIVPGADFKGGLSALYLDLGLGLPPLFVGLIRDVDGDGRIGPNDIMFPPEATDITDGVSTVVLPLFGFGDYFPYLLTDRPPGLDTEMTVRDGSTILLGTLMPDETAVPFLGDVPFVGRVFGDESRQTEETELLIFLTPRLLPTDEG